MFKIVDVDSLLWPVTVHVPRDDGTGDTDERELKIRYRYLSTSDYEAALKDVLDADGDKDFRPYVMGWEDIAGADGKPLKFSQANLNKVMATRFVAQAINKGFRDCQDAGLAKN